MNDERRRQWWGAGALVMGGAAVVVYVQSGTVDVRNSHGEKTVSKGHVAAATEHSAPQTSPSVQPNHEPTVAAPQVKRRAMTAAERKKVLARLDAALKHRTPPAQSPAPETPSAKRDEEPQQESAGLSKDYIREVVREDLVPIVQECYNAALEDEPDLSGKLVLKFAIVGDESVGGIVEEVALDESSTLINPALEECMTESTASLLFDPPQGGGRIQVTYPMVFYPSDPQE